MTLSAQNLWLIPALPLLAAGISSLLPRRGRALSAALAIAAMTGSFILSCFALSAALSSPAEHITSNFTWFCFGDTAMRLGWLLDPLTAFMCVMVSFVSTLIFIFSLGYMREDAELKQFFCFLSLFASAMLGIVVANSLLLLFIAWELVGLSSYLLIGFWFQRPSAAAAAKKAFITTRIGDLGFLLGILWLNDATGSLLFYDGGHGVLEASALGGLTAHFALGGLALSTAIGLLIFCGAVGKSGQFPLHVWLPDAMEGPTPVSALIHAATMVAAGVFLIARVYPLMTADLGLAGVPVHALTIVAFIGAFTALLGACIAVGQNDIKRVLAFSTVSQLGYMMLALGVGSWVAAIFHLLTHAFFKALLLLGAGSVIHAAHHEQDMRSLGGLGKRMRVTFATFAVGMMALSGVPFVFSGYWSKEAILHAAREWDVSHLPLVMGLIAVALTAFYMMRLVAEVFLGKPRSASAEHAHENSAVITVPLVLLAICAVGLGFIGTPAWPWLQSRLSGVPIPAHSLLEGGGLIGASIFLVAVGLGTGWWLYARRLRESSSSLDPIAAAAPGVFAFLAARMKFDELYLATVGRANTALADFSSWLDRRVIGAGVSLIARMGESAGAFNKETDEEGLNTGFNAASDELRLAGRLYSKAQSGETHGYLRVIAVGFVILAIASLFGGGR